MKYITQSVIALSTLFFFNCDKDDDELAPSGLESGEFEIKIYNEDGVLLLTKKGDAENLGGTGSWEIRLLDPMFGTENGDDSQNFASLTFFGQSPLNELQTIELDEDRFAVFHQRWYSLPDDWGYRTLQGTLRISERHELMIKGSFEIRLTTDPSMLANPKWGERIFIKGSFSSICPYESVGGCD
jgi:hypothetical protein